MVKAVRGATSLVSDSEEELQKAVLELYDELALKNHLHPPRIISIIFSQTPDISFNPAKALRLGRKLNRTALFCTQEAQCRDFPQALMLRVLITYRTFWWRKPQTVYKGRAAQLRK